MLELHSFSPDRGRPRASIHTQATVVMTSRGTGARVFKSGAGLRHISLASAWILRTHEEAQRRSAASAEIIRSSGTFVLLSPRP